MVGEEDRGTQCTSQRLSCFSSVLSRLFCRWSFRQCWPIVVIVLVCMVLMIRLVWCFLLISFTCLFIPTLTVTEKQQWQLSWEEGEFNSYFYFVIPDFSPFFAKAACLLYYAHKGERSKALRESAEGCKPEGSQVWGSFLLSEHHTSLALKSIKIIE